MAKLRQKEYEDLVKEVTKYAEDFPFQSVPHFLLGDLLFKLELPDASLEHFLACLELGLPTRDLLQSAEYELASLLSQYQVAPHLNATLLSKASEWWKSDGASSFFQAGENSFEWLKQQQVAHDFSRNLEDAGSARIRYLAVKNAERFKILAWEKI